ncbi:xanthine dehydrogenase family protein molybdopterin-binding subunit [Solimicrobium silvestre]|uniref:Aerobic-type carbon monoxide dehydrogenase large subunit CoxL/CutL-like protein n=1 Tax=Solimicrobium silvestre TaxID=2099400 RepID=A0A2S9GXR0_9BURK|nr:xanthine dehydrogenase family protein molybdopterin-binding subunit [Solimicrobium silvestre]PRC92446.1 Aerobic-type carbon monoxide dehydrogenase large subunit CoxL/CutL -like protein [Solimicrobium silvestre]
MKNIGDPIARVDGRLKVTGAALYSAEIPLLKTAYAVLVTSTIASGRITVLDEDRARSIAGVIAVFSYKNAPRLSRPKMMPAGQSIPILQSPDIYYGGQVIAVVLAESLESATHAASLVTVSYSTKVAAIDMNAHLASAFVPAKRQTGEDPSSKRGDTTAGLAQADIKLDLLYTTPVEHHNPMEPHATTAVWEGDQLTVYDATQAVTNSAHSLAQILGVPVANVRVISRFLGGGFGCKGMSWPHVAIAAMTAREIKRPVKLVLTRPQMFTSNGHRPTTRQSIHIGANRDGKLMAINHHVDNHTSALDNFTEASGSPTEFLYACNNVEILHRLVRLNTGTPTFTRAPGFASGSFGLESAMDEMACKLDIDPVEFRLRNFAAHDQADNLPWSSNSLRECYAAAAARFGWEKRKATTGSQRDGRWLIGYGMASATYPAHFQAASANATIFADGKVLVQCGTQDLGTGTYTVMSQTAASVLGVEVEQVRFELGDTRLPPAPGSGGSTTAASAGSAVFNTVQKLRDRLIQLAATDTSSPLHGIDEKLIVIRDGRLSSTGVPGRSETLIKLLSRQSQPSVSVTSSTGPGPEQGYPTAQTPGNVPGEKPKSHHSYKIFGAHFCEVRVDPELGEVKVTRMVSAFAGGRILNARTARSQLQGGMIWGIGMALMEETRIDTQRGFFSNANLADYLLPVNADIPSIEALLVEEVDPYVNPIGSKGLGEIGIVGVAAAVANAVYNATGKRIRDLPITVDKII